MTAARERLPNRRASESFSFEVNGLRFTATVSRFSDGRNLSHERSGFQMPATGRWTFGLRQVVFGDRLAEGRSGRFFERIWGQVGERGGRPETRPSPGSSFRPNFFLPLSAARINPMLPSNLGGT